jgi:hypothetical protein
LDKKRNFMLANPEKLMYCLFDANQFLRKDRLIAGSGFALNRQATSLTAIEAIRSG